MALREFSVTVEQTVSVVLDDEKLDQEFDEHFSKSFCKVEGLEDHAKNLAHQEARSLIGFDRFVEGYGDLNNLNCSVSVGDIREICDEVVTDE